MEGEEDLCGSNVQSVRSALNAFGRTVEIHENERFFPMVGWSDPIPEQGDPTRFEDSEGKSWMKVPCGACPSAPSITGSLHLRGFDVVARRQAVMPVPGTDQFPPDATITQAARAVLSLSNLSNLNHTVVCRLLSAVL